MTIATPGHPAGRLQRLQRASRWIRRQPRRAARWLGRRDLRWWFVLLYVTVGMVVMYQLLSFNQDSNDRQTRTFERQIAENCQQSNTDATNFNRVLDQLATNTRNSRALTPANKQQALKVYAQLHRTLTKCPPPPSS